MNKRIVILLLFALSIQFVQAQTKISPRVDLEYFQQDSKSTYLKVKVRKKVEKRFEPITNVRVDFFLEGEDEAIQLGDAITNELGEAKITLAEEINGLLLSLEEYQFSAEVAASNESEAVFETITIIPGRLKITTDDGDGKLVKVLVESMQDGEWEPVEGVELKVFIKRTFGQLTLGEEVYTSDENGWIEVPFEEEIPGDDKGNITLGCSAEDHEELGNLSGFTTVDWGVPFKDDDHFNKRTLWATRDKTPFWLLIFPNLIIAGVWSVIVYLCFQIFRIKRLGKPKDYQINKN